MSNDTFNYTEARSRAAQGALVMGALWTGSFLCAVSAFTHPALGHVGNLLAVVSVFVLVNALRNVGRGTTGFHFGRRWWMGWTTCMNASLLTTLCQYLYFRFLDGGRLMQSVTAMMETAEYREALKALSPDFEPDEMVSALGAMTVGDMIVSLLTFNLMASMLVSLIAALFSGGKSSDTHTTSA